MCRVILFAVLIGGLVASCEEVATVDIIAPSQLAGASVVVDGQQWDHLELHNGMAIARVAISPFHRHEVRIEKRGLKPIIRQVSYEGYGTWTLEIDAKEIRGTTSNTVERNSRAAVRDVESLGELDERQLVIASRAEQSTGLSGHGVALARRLHLSGRRPSRRRTAARARRPAPLSSRPPRPPASSPPTTARKSPNTITLHGARS
jgi:hypothetical protein